VRLTSLRLPLITLCGHHQLLLDTGSREVWIADSACLDCPITTSACPHIARSTSRIDYFRGSVTGDFTYINSCLGTLRVFCAKTATDMHNLEAVGILGIQGQSSGRKLLEALIQLPSPSNSSIAIYYGIKEAQLLVGGVPADFIRERVEVRVTGEWTVALMGIRLDQQPFLPYDCHILMDTGTNLLILPQALFRQLALQIDSALLQLSCHRQQLLTYSCPF
jgi:hypothetical protein